MKSPPRGIKMKPKSNHYGRVERPPSPQPHIGNRPPPPHGLFISMNVIWIWMVRACQWRLQAKRKKIMFRNGWIAIPRRPLCPPIVYIYRPSRALPLPCTAQSAEGQISYTTESRSIAAPKSHMHTVCVNRRKSHNTKILLDRQPKWLSAQIEAESKWRRVWVKEYMVRGERERESEHNRIGWWWWLASGK